MPPKKREKDLDGQKGPRMDQIQADHELFLQAFESECRARPSVTTHIHSSLRWWCPLHFSHRRLLAVRVRRPLAINGQRFCPSMRLRALGDFR